MSVTCDYSGCYAQKSSCMCMSHKLCFTLNQASSVSYTDCMHDLYALNTLYVIVAPQLAEEKLQEHWKSNCPDLRRLESQQMQRAVEEEWKGQIKQRQEVCHLLEGCLFICTSLLCLLLFIIMVS